MPPGGRGTPPQPSAGRFGIRTTSVPVAVTAVMAWLAFGETLDAWALAGMVLIAIGVALARRPEPP